MPFFLDGNPTSSEISEAVNYLLSNFSQSVTADPSTGQIVGPAGTGNSYLYKYIDVKYADSFDGTLNFSNLPTNRLYYGLRNDDSSTESTNPSDYIWYKLDPTTFPSGFGTTYFLYYITTGNRSIQFGIATSTPNSGWLVAPLDAIDLDVTTATNSVANFVVIRVANSSAAPTDAECIAAIGRTPTSGDLCTVNYNSGIYSIVYKYTTGWAIFQKYITGDLIVANSIVGNNIAAATITASNIAANTITASNIAANTITASNIAANTITGNKIAASTITGSNISASTISTDLIISNSATEFQNVTQSVADDVWVGYDFYMRHSGVVSFFSVGSWQQSGSGGSYSYYLGYSDSTSDTGPANYVGVTGSWYSSAAPQVGGLIISSYFYTGYHKLWVKLQISTNTGNHASYVQILRSYR